MSAGICLYPMMRRNCFCATKSPDPTQLTWQPYPTPPLVLRCTTPLLARPHVLGKISSMQPTGEGRLSWEGDATMSGPPLRASGKRLAHVPPFPEHQPACHAAL